MQSTLTKNEDNWLLCFRKLTTNNGYYSVAKKKTKKKTEKMAIVNREYKLSVIPNLDRLPSLVYIFLTVIFHPKFGY